MAFNSQYWHWLTFLPARFGRLRFLWRDKGEIHGSLLFLSIFLSFFQISSEKGLQDLVAECLSQWEEDFLQASWLLFAQKGTRRFSQKSWFAWRTAKQTGTRTNQCYWQRKTLLEVTQRNWLICPAATKKCTEQNVVVSRTSDDAVGKLVFNGNWEVRLGKMSGVAF